MTAAIPENRIADEKVVLRVKGLRKAFGGQVVLSNVNLELRQGEVVLLRGDNGAGKTTLINILTGNLEPDAGELVYLSGARSRSYRFPRRWWNEINPFDHFTPEFVENEGVGRTWQDVRLFGSHSLRDNIVVASQNSADENPLGVFTNRASRAGREATLTRNADSLLETLGLSGRQMSSADKISLGQSKRVAIARAVAGGAKVLFLDEPLAGLDRDGIQDVVGYLERLLQNDGITLVIVEHVFNQQHLRNLVTSHWFMADGDVTCMPADREPALLRLQVDQPAIEKPHKPAWYTKLVGEGAEILEEALPRGAILTRIRPQSARHETQRAAVVEVRDLVVRRGTRPVIGLDGAGAESGLQLTLRENEIAVLQAPNGWGKSTLLDAIAGLLMPDRGEILLDASAINTFPAWERARLGILTLRSDDTGFPNLRDHEMARLAGCDAGAYAGTSNRFVSSMSGGERQQLAQMCLQLESRSTAVALLDEPFKALDERAASDFIEQILAATLRACLITIPLDTNVD